MKDSSVCFIKRPAYVFKNESKLVDYAGASRSSAKLSYTMRGFVKDYLGCVYSHIGRQPTVNSWSLENNDSSVYTGENIRLLNESRNIFSRIHYDL